MQNGRKTNRIRTNLDRQRHSLTAQSGGRRMPPVRNKRALTARKETMSGIWRSPKLKPKAAT